jgi:sugar transferase (PEP-CTERM system associated)
MFRFSRPKTVHRIALLGFGELLVLAGSLNLATRLRYFRYPEELAQFSYRMPERSFIFAIAILLSMAALGLYDTHMRTNWFGVLAHQVVAFIVGAVFLSVGYYVLPQAYVGRGVMTIALLLGFVGVTAFRTVFLRLCDIKALKRRVLILGAGERASQFHFRMRRRSDRRNFCLVGYVPRPNEIVAVPFDLLIHGDQSLQAVVQVEQVDEIVVGVDDRRGSLPMDDLLECKQLGVPVTDLATFFERESGRVQLGLVDPSWLVFSAGFHATPLRRVSKRCFDLAVAVVIIALSWPLMLAVWLAIRLESGPGQPILYRQERVGEHGQTFWMMKFRSMRTDAERDGVARWASKQDDRVTRVGRITRKLRLDELPQLWNVLSGDMSIVGPRPERPQFVTELATKIRYYNVRHSLKPGLTGWAQLLYPYGASELEAAEKLKYDLFYVKNHNLVLDLLILIQTLEVVLFGRGAR